MYRTILFILATICPAVGFSLTVTYLTTYKLTTEGPLMTCENILATDSSGSSFYSTKQLRQLEINDSLKLCDVSLYDAIDVWKREKVLGHSSFAVFKDYPSKGRITVTDELLGFYRYEEPMPVFNWNVTDCDTIILGHHARKAETAYRGRRWTVSYATDILVNDGPWKFCGLPGLILYAKDAKGDFSFEAKEIKDDTTSHAAAQLFTARARLSSAAEMARLRRLMFWDDSQFTKEVMGKSSQLFDASGHPLPPSHKHACLIEYPK